MTNNKEYNDTKAYNMVLAGILISSLFAFLLFISYLTSATEASSDLGIGMLVILFLLYTIGYYQAVGIVIDYRPKPNLVTVILRKLCLVILFITYIVYIVILTICISNLLLL